MQSDEGTEPSSGSSLHASCCHPLIVVTVPSLLLRITGIFLPICVRVVRMLVRLRGGWPL
jgi:hypothetical protein